jgi:hypothetical protein
MPATGRTLVCAWTRTGVAPPAARLWFGLAVSALCLHHPSSASAIAGAPLTMPRRTLQPPTSEDRQAPASGNEDRRGAAGTKDVFEMGHGFGLVCQGWRPRAGARRRTMRAIMAHLIIASEVAGSRS